MRLERPQLRRLLFLLAMQQRGRLDSAGERELREVVRSQGYIAEAEARDLTTALAAGERILFAYHVVEGIHVDTLVDNAQPA